ncbi:MAG: hypothetical protein GWN71_19860, partial [Gammaproteobacteria bacterium]|nr:hypothetical protein [Gemmatimonadota bacterium]NIU75739.1 hypothetical protein [Gammaproteobacteria bacterium]
MARPLKVTVRYGEDVYHAAIPGDERADQLLLRSLHHFGIDTDEKRHYHLKPRGADRPVHGIYLDHPIGEQVVDGGELVLEERVAGNRHLS